MTLIGEAVFARCLSALKDERVKASTVLTGPKPAVSADRAAFIEEVRRALYCSKMISYAQGYMLLREAAKDQKWNLNFGGIALMWRGGCIIRSRFLGKIKEAYDKNPQLNNLLLDDFFSKLLNDYQAPGGEPSSMPSKQVSRLRRSQPRCPSSTDTARADCLPTCCKRNAISLAPTPTSASTSRVVSFSTPTGQAAAAA